MRLKNHIFIILFVASLLVLNYPDNLDADGSMAVPEMSVDEVQKLLTNPDVMIIDVRRQKTWWSGMNKILTAIREDPAKVSQWYTIYSKDKILIFYCS